MVFAAVIAVLGFSACSVNDEEASFSNEYDLLQINGVDCACYGYRCGLTYESEWNMEQREGEILLPCTTLTNTSSGDYDFNYLYTIYLNGNRDLKKGCKLEDFNARLENTDNWEVVNYESGTATVIEKIDNKYITISFDQFKFGEGGNSFTLNGTVQLSLTKG